MRAQTRPGPLGGVPDHMGEQGVSRARAEEVGQAGSAACVVAGNGSGRECSEWRALSGVWRCGCRPRVCGWWGFRPHAYPSVRDVDRPRRYGCHGVPPTGSGGGDTDPGRHPAVPGARTTGAPTLAGSPGVRPAHRRHASGPVGFRAACPASGRADGAPGGSGPPPQGDCRPGSPAAPLLAAAAVIAVGGTAMALLTPDSSGNDVMLSEIRPSAPVASTIAPVPSPTLSVQASGHSPSPSASRSPSPSASRVSSSTSPASSLPAAPSTPPSPSPSVDRLPSHEPPPSQAPILRFGDSGPEVERVQRLLAMKGLYKGKIHGRFDRGVRQALSKFQLALGIEDDGWGTYGPSTRRALEE
ncbi:peptidoglycan-binding protein [Streptomyces sp. DK15]|uniref:peptidoglycan-binding domain-containing protein n=1 Tax=Streptomyces sp. DK15 TaxID=2957499 RepID=UPI0034DF56A9